MKNCFVKEKTAGLRLSIYNPGNPSQYLLFRVELQVARVESQERRQGVCVTRIKGISVENKEAVFFDKYEPYAIV